MAKKFVTASNNGKILTLQEEALGSLRVKDQVYDGTIAVDLTDTIDSMIEEKQGTNLATYPTELQSGSGVNIWDAASNSAIAVNVADAPVESKKTILMTDESGNVQVNKLTANLISTSDSGDIATDAAYDVIYEPEVIAMESSAGKGTLSKADIAELELLPLKYITYKGKRYVCQTDTGSETVWQFVNIGTTGGQVDTSDIVGTWVFDISRLVQFFNGNSWRDWPPSLNAADGNPRVGYVALNFSTVDGKNWNTLVVTDDWGGPYWGVLIYSKYSGNPIEVSPDDWEHPANLEAKSPYDVDIGWNEDNYKTIVVSSGSAEALAFLQATATKQGGSKATSVSVLTLDSTTGAWTVEDADLGGGDNGGDTPSAGGGTQLYSHLVKFVGDGTQYSFLVISPTESYKGVYSLYQDVAALKAVRSDTNRPVFFLDATTGLLGWMQISTNVNNPTWEFKFIDGADGFEDTVTPI